MYSNTWRRAAGIEDATLICDNLSPCLHLLPHESAHLTALMQGRLHLTVVFNLACNHEPSVSCGTLSDQVVGCRIEFALDALIGRSREESDVTGAGCDTSMSKLLCCSTNMAANSVSCCMRGLSPIMPMQLFCADHDLVLHDGLPGNRLNMAHLT